MSILPEVARGISLRQSPDRTEVTMSFVSTNPGSTPDASWRNRQSAVFAVILLAGLLSGCGGAADGGGTAAAADDRAQAGRVAPGSDQETSETPRLGPDGRPIRVERVTVGGVPISVEIADTRELREVGLMNRDELPDDYGMLFVYPDERIRSFWMRNTRIPLDIAFIDRNGSIVNIEQMEPQTDENTISAGPVMYALEMNVDWFASNDVEPGDRLEF
ncbi:MAG: DUF192 domain-containing protein [marine benthic group bacterium]|nr:DUF192 domain-containing protein [Gemmatimonadota bacterium]MCL7957902.1 DUF192 domain-containing protein [Gemmatimonadota bacterium]MCL7966804.1 DUF192 domain-containing protein [Gemmatimonadota bacterium]MCL7973229.1 DUF192 domain-containing protein [Gemmatimonadota bacterium]MCL7978751.1 DUF192 domain-containing protein [Gemmatimonadota bacterium]